MPIKVQDTTLYTIAEITKVLNVSTATVRNYIKNGSLTGKKLVGFWFIADHDLKMFLKQMTKES